MRTMHLSVNQNLGYEKGREEEKEKKVKGPPHSITTSPRLRYQSFNI